VPITAVAFQHCNINCVLFVCPLPPPLPGQRTHLRHSSVDNRNIFSILPCGARRRCGAGITCDRPPWRNAWTTPFPTRYTLPNRTYCGYLYLPHAVPHFTQHSCLAPYARTRHLPAYVPARCARTRPHHALTLPLPPVPFSLYAVELLPARPRAPTPLIHDALLGNLAQLPVARGLHAAFHPAGSRTPSSRCHNTRAFTCPLPRAALYRRLPLTAAAAHARLRPPPRRPGALRAAPYSSLRSARAALLRTPAAHHRAACRARRTPPSCGLVGPYRDMTHKTNANSPTPDSLNNFRTRDKCCIQQLTAFLNYSLSFQPTVPWFRVGKPRVTHSWLPHLNISLPSCSRTCDSLAWIRR